MKDLVQSIMIACSVFSGSKAIKCRTDFKNCVDYKVNAPLREFEKQTAICDKNKHVMIHPCAGEKMNKDGGITYTKNFGWGIEEWQMDQYFDQCVHEKGLM